LAEGLTGFTDPAAGTPWLSRPNGPGAPAAGTSAVPDSGCIGSDSSVETSGSIGFWFLGVNFRWQALHRRMHRSPIVLVRRLPLATDSLLPQYGHLYGLPTILTSWVPPRAWDI
jgi:hypothetical protein